ncbi:MAG: substrate-binding domain-containing protein, partial [Actinobacteria bacterium]|nr:substrate-binding domain-containing protein [Actinomycetota bacterium]
MTPTPRRSKLVLFLLPAVVAALFALPAAASASTVIVQGTTDVRDAGLLEDVIEPGFHAAYPQYELKYIAVGTGQAIANAKAGQGDALMVHAPSQEKTFVEEGYSLEPRGRAVFYSDYVIPGPLNDPAEVLAKAPHNAVLAYELIAKAGAEGKANFVSRGDKSGTNTQELAIWKLTKVELNKLGEPGPKGTETDFPWYHKAGTGQAETVKLTSQCPESTFTGGGCYEMTDRGTLNRLLDNGSVTNLKIVSQNNEAGAPGGQNLLTNPFTVYAINPAKVPGVNVNVEGARALIEYMTSEAFQARLASYPNAREPAFFADAHPKMTAGPSLTGTYAPGALLKVSGNISNVLPGSPAVAGQPVLLQRLTSLKAGETPAYQTVGLALTGADGSYSISAEATRNGAMRVEMPTTTTYPSLAITPLISSGALTKTDIAVGEVTVQSKIAVKKPSRKGRVVTLRGKAGPSAERGEGAQVVVQGRKLGTKKKQKFHA